MSMKVYGSNAGFNHSIVAANSKAEAMRVAQIGRYEFDLYWTETGNADDIAIAMQHPQQLLVQPNNRKMRDWWKAEFTSSRPYDEDTDPLDTP